MTPGEARLMSHMGWDTKRWRGFYNPRAAGAGAAVVAVVAELGVKARW